jgi:hypothetical protein
VHTVRIVVVGAVNDPREVVADPRARYFGALQTERMLLPDDNAQLGKTRFEDWLSQPMPQVVDECESANGVAETIDGWRGCRRRAESVAPDL